MPAEGVQLTERSKLLTNEEIFYIARLFVEQGVRKIRLTGGEPTVRKDIVHIIGEPLIFLFVFYPLRICRCDLFIFLRVLSFVWHRELEANRAFGTGEYHNKRHNVDAIAGADATCRSEWP